MTPRAKFLVLCFALIVPYFVGMLVLVSKYPPDNLPVWAFAAGGVYLFLTVCALALFSKVIFKRQPGPPTEEELQRENWSRNASKRLLVLWGVLFAYGAWKTMTGEIPAARAVPAAILLVLFISLFAYPLWHGRDRDHRSTDASSESRAK